MEKWHAAKPGSVENGRAAVRPREVRARRSPRLPSTPRSSAPRWSRRRAGTRACRDHGRDGRRHGALDLCRELPEQYYDVGIAEQHAVLFAAGLALEGMKPVAAIYSTFLQRALRPDRPRRLPPEAERRVLHGPRRARRRRRPDPPRRLRHLLPAPLPNIVLMAPRDEAMLVHMLRTALDARRARSRCATRAAPATACRSPGAPEIGIGTGEMLRRGRAVALIGYGTGVQLALGAAEGLRDSGHRADRLRRALREAARRRAARCRCAPTTSCS